MNTKILRLLFGASLLFFLASGTAWADKILITQYEYSGYSAMKSNLENFGHTVDVVNAKTGGSIANALSSDSYDQVFLWDLSSKPYISQADLDSLSTFFTEHNSLVVDSRSYGYLFQPNQASEVALLGNIAREFSSRGGGVWVGTDHNPHWTYNSNPFLEAIGVEPVLGIYGDAVNAYDPASVLLDGVVATDLWGGGQTVGAAPLGIQPNGIDMRFHFGHSSASRGAIPYITANFGGFIAPDEDPATHISTSASGSNPVPEPATLVLLGSGLIGLSGFRKKRLQK